VLRHVMGEAQFDPDLRRMLLERLLEPRRDAPRRLLHRRMPHSIRQDAMVTAIYGAIWHRLLLNEKLDTAFAAHLAALFPADRR
jgi:hypothetical protein